MESLGLGDALLVLLIGMAIVFFGLTVLILLIKMLVKVTNGMGRKSQPAPAPAPVIPAAPLPETVEEEVSVEDNGPLIAAITAALVVAMEGTAFQVRHVRRIQNTPAWHRAGRDEQIYSRL